MNEELERFERRLSNQPLRPVPRDWREEILATAGRGSGVESREREPLWPSTLVARLSSLLWPHPRAWAGLAAVWVVILAVDFSLRDNPPARAEKASPPSPEVMVELRQQQRLLAELAGLNQTHDTDRQKMFVPTPRSERAERVTV